MLPLPRWRGNSFLNETAHDEVSRLSSVTGVTIAGKFRIYFFGISSATSWGPFVTLCSREGSHLYLLMSTKLSRQNNLDGWTVIQVRGKTWIFDFAVNCPFKTLQAASSLSCPLTALAPCFCTLLRVYINALARVCTNIHFLLCSLSWTPVWAMPGSSCRMRCWGGWTERTASRPSRRSWSFRRTSTLRSDSGNTATSSPVNHFVFPFVRVSPDIFFHYQAFLALFIYYLIFQLGVHGNNIAPTWCESICQIHALICSTNRGGKHCFYHIGTSQFFKKK